MFRRLLLGALTGLALLAGLASAPTFAGAHRPPAVTRPVPVPSAARYAEAANVHVLIVGDTNDGGPNGVGPACRKDVQAFQHFLRMTEAAHPDLRGRIKAHVLTGRRSSPASVRAYYRNLRSGPNDNLLFYLTSHGAMRRGAASPEEAHVLNLNTGMGDTGRMTRAEVRRLMQQKRPRGIIILTDVCSSYCGETSAVRANTTVRRAAPGTAPNRDTVRNLLFRAPRLVSITAAQDGRTASCGHVGTAFGDASSAFTVALLHVCCDPQRTFASWNELFPALRYETYTASGRQHWARHFLLREYAGGGLRRWPTPSSAVAASIRQR